jgi:hypothetical protein
MLHESHLGDMQGPVLALAQLCEAFPAHPEWIRWYTGVVLYSEYLRAIARYTEPYGMLPESLYRDDDPGRSHCVWHRYAQPLHPLRRGAFQQPSRKVEAGEGGSHTVRWTGVVESARAPWIVVVIPDGDVTHRKEIKSLPR